MLAHRAAAGPCSRSASSTWRCSRSSIGYYVIKALNVDVSVSASLPDIPQTLLVALTGSNSLYLAGKIARG